MNFMSWGIYASHNVRKSIWFWKSRCGIGFQTFRTGLAKRPACRLCDDPLLQTQSFMFLRNISQWMKGPCLSYEGPMSSSRSFKVSRERFLFWAASTMGTDVSRKQRNVTTIWGETESSEESYKMGRKNIRIHFAQENAKMFASHRKHAASWWQWFEWSNSNHVLKSKNKSRNIAHIALQNLLWQVKAFSSPAHEYNIPKPYSKQTHPFLCVLWAWLEWTPIILCS